MKEIEIPPCVYGVRDEDYEDIVQRHGRLDLTRAADPFAQAIRERGWVIRLTPEEYLE